MLNSLLFLLAYVPKCFQRVIGTSSSRANNWIVVSFQSIFADSTKVLLVTSMGNMTIGLYDDIPITTGNLKNLVRTEVYVGTIFHRIAPGFVIQDGDATSKGITVPPIQDELPNKRGNVRGSVAMAKTSVVESPTLPRVSFS